MSRKRLIISAAATLVLAAALTGCSLGDDDEAATTVTVTTEGTDGASTETGGGSSGETVTIIASVPPTDHGWLGAISKNAQAAADAHDDVEFTLLEAADADSQAQQIEQAISQNPDALVVLPQDGAALTPVARRASRPASPWSTSTACSRRLTPPRPRCWATTTSSACSQPSTSPRS